MEKELFEENAFNELYEEPGCSARKMTVFNAAYPDDPWAIKTDPRS